VTSPKSMSLEATRARVRSAAGGVGFFRLVRLLEAELGIDVDASTTVDHERLRFVHSAASSRPAADVSCVDLDESGGVTTATVTTTFFGLLGGESPLSPSYTEQARADDAGGIAAFLGVLEHRAVALLYSSWKRYAHTASYRASGTDRLSRALLSLVGVDAFSPVQDEKTAVDPMLVLGLSDLARCDVAYLDLHGFQRVLRRLFPELNLRVTWSAPRFVETDLADRGSLGRRGVTLGVDFAYGTGALDATAVVRIEVGPVTGTVCEELMPGGARYRAMQPIVDEWLASRAIAELEVAVTGDEAPRFRLGNAVGSRLGVDSRLAEAQPQRVRVRVLLVPDGAPPREYVEGDDA
jgi:type VI secretion system protein ImpH